MRIIVVGAGAMGSLYGGKLKISGNDVVLVDIQSEHISAIKADGLKIEEKEGVQTVSVAAGFAHEICEKADLVFVFTKTMHTKVAVKSILHLVHDETMVITLQNGLGNIELLEAFFPPERIIAGITNFPGDFIGPGHIRAAGSGETRIMQIRNHGSGKLESVRKALDDAGFNCTTTADLFPFIWEKVAFNAAMNALTAIANIAVGPLGLSPDGRELAFEVAAEVLAVAEKKGLAVNREKVRTMMSEAFLHHFDHKPSMLQDIQAGRKTEVDAINGAVVREAEIAGISAPVNAVLYKLVKTIEDARDRNKDHSV